MSDGFAMDQSDKVGLGAAVGGHALLLALLVFGLVRAATPMGSDGGGSEGDGISVSIVSEMSSDAPAPSPDVVEPVPVVEEIAEVLTEETPEPAVVKKPQPTKIAQKTTVKNPSKKTGFGSPDYERRLKEEAERERKGGGGKPKNDGTGSGSGDKPSTSVKQKIEVSINGAVKKPWQGCKFSGIDAEKLVTVVRFKLTKSGGLAGITSVSTNGRTASNQTQVKRHQECAKGAITAAAPFTLPAEYFEYWQNYELEFFKR